MTTPHSAGSGGPAFTMPAGACDCHMHLFDSHLPFADGAMLRHGDATVADYRQLQRRLGTSRNVVVQPSSYGLDHRVLVAGLKALGDSARGVAVIDPQVHADDLQRLAADGVVGVRFNLVQQGATDESMLEAVAHRIAPLGWHLQLHVHAQHLLRLSERLAALPVPVVLDHYARIRTDPALAERVHAELCRLLGTGQVWLKLSAPYIASLDGPEYSDLEPFVQNLVQQFPDRLVWGSDWPHVTEAQKPDDAHLLGQLARWIPNEAQRERILVDNPRALYRF